MNGKKAFRNYDLLVDVFFWALLASLVMTSLHVMTIVPATMLSGQWPLLDALIFGFAAVSKYGSFVLILMRRLRDEYSENLWRQAAGTYTKLIILAPVYWIGYMIYLRFAEYGTPWLRTHPDALLLPLSARFPNPQESVGIYQLEALNFVMAKLTGTLPLIFLGLYKWHRWRGVR